MQERFWVLAFAGKSGKAKAHHFEAADFFEALNFGLAASFFLVVFLVVFFLAGADFFFAGFGFSGDRTLSLKPQRSTMGQRQHSGRRALQI